MKKKSNVRIKKTANFAPVAVGAVATVGALANAIFGGGSRGWSKLNGTQKQELIRTCIKIAIKSGKRTFKDIMDFTYYVLTQTIEVQADYSYFYASNLWIWQKEYGVLGGVIQEEIDNYNSSPEGIAEKQKDRLKQAEVDSKTYATEKEKEAADYNLQKAKELADAKAAAQAAKDQKDMASGGSTAKVALIAGGVIFLIILGIFLYKKYA